MKKKQRKIRFHDLRQTVHRVLICGDREYLAKYAPVIRKLIRELVDEHGTKNLLVIEGGAPGVDSLVKLAAHKVNVHVAEIQALWDIRGKGAGMQRNEMMAALDPHEVIGIHSNIEISKGTKGMLEMAEEFGIPNRLIEP